MPWRFHLSSVNQSRYDWEALGKVLTELKRASLLVVGDLMLDEYVFGTIDRISPEAPVQVLNWTSGNASLGGAANVANNLARLGCEVFLAGAIGRDHAGDELLRLAKTSGINAGGVLADVHRATTVKTRLISHGKQILRVDKESRAELDETSAAALLAFVKDCLPKVQGVVLSDYSKGVLGQKITSAVIRMASAAGRPVFVDPKGDDFAKYRGALLLTPNKLELGRAAQKPVRTEDEIRSAVDTLFSQTDCQAILVTRSEEGMSLYKKGAGETRIQAEVHDVFDLTGAGDTVISVIARVFLGGHDLETAARLANAAAGIKVEKVGTAAVSIDELSSWIRERSSRGATKLVDLSQVRQRVSLAHSQGLKVVFANGCFDLLHAGHVQFLQKAKALGNVLVVAINDDDSTRQIKGNGRPLISVKDRAGIIAALESVDYVIVFSEVTPLRLIEELRPDVLVKGGNYTLEEVVGRTEVERYGGRVALIPAIDTQSSSQIIRDIVANHQRAEEVPGRPSD